MKKDNNQFKTFYNGVIAPQKSEGCNTNNIKSLDEDKIILTSLCSEEDFDKLQNIYYKIKNLQSESVDYAQTLRGLKDLCPKFSADYLLNTFGTVDSEAISKKYSANTFIAILLSNIILDLENSVLVDDYISKIIEERNKNG